MKKWLQSTMQAIAGAIGTSEYVGGTRRQPLNHRQSRPCLLPTCHRLHNHNNAYCSAECCKHAQRIRKLRKAS